MHRAAGRSDNERSDSCAVGCRTLPGASPQLLVCRVTDPTEGEKSADGGSRDQLIQNVGACRSESIVMLLEVGITVEPILIVARETPGLRDVKAAGTHGRFRITAHLGRERLPIE